jgi:competence protein ComEC
MEAHYPHFRTDGMVSVALGGLLGAVSVQQLQSLPPVEWSWLLLVTVPWCAASRRLRLPLAVLCGALWTLLQAHARLHPGLDPAQEGRDLVVEGVVATIPQPKARLTRFQFDVKRALRNGTPIEIPSRIRLNWYAERPPLGVGQRWRLTVRLKRPRSFHNPGGFDYTRWLFLQGIQATGYVRAGQGVQRLDDAPLSHPLDALREAVAGRIGRASPADPNRGIITALAIGERHGIAPSQWRLLLDTGTNHLLAISGLHIGLIAGLVYLLVGRAWRLSHRLCRRWPAPHAAAVAAGAAGLVYALLAGVSLPTQRALIMLTVVMGAVLLDRSVRPGHTLAVAMLGVLIWDPLAVLSASFWMSFTAVAVILYGFVGRSRARFPWWQWGRVQWLLALGLVPLTLAVFQRATLVAPLANLLAVPWVGWLIVPLVLTGTACLYLWPALGEMLLRLASGAMDLMWRVLETLAELPIAAWHHQPAFWTLIPAWVGVAWLLAPRGWPARWLGVALLLPLGLITPPRPAPGGFRLTLLDVGQGLSAVVQTHTHTLVYDTGARFGDSLDMGEAVLIPFLRSRDIGRIDTLVITHADNDHSGGAQALLETLAVDQVLSGAPARPPFQRAQPCVAGQNWEWDGVNFQVLHPPAVWTGTENDRSCVLRVANAGGALLLSADIEIPAEAWLVQTRAGALASDIILVPHHGSRTSSSGAFLDAVGPSIALVSAGYRNRFGFPKPEVLARYESRGVQVLDTVEQGAIRITVRPDTGMTVQPGYRGQTRRYWTP